MSSVQEITEAVSHLDQEDLGQVGLFVLRKIRESGRLPEPRRFTKEEVEGWIAEDERDMADLRAGR